jgi:hypothetical protein
MKQFVALLAIIIVLHSCKEKEAANSDSDYFPATAYIKSQIAHIDTSLFTIKKVVQHDTLSDTIYLKREEFKKEAGDFLALPDISSKKLKKNYNETKQYDEELHKITFIYFPKEKDQEIQQEIIIVKPDPNIDKVETIFVDWLQTTDDGIVQMKMTWQANKYFRTITITQKKGQQDKTEKTEVYWNDPSAE